MKHYTLSPDWGEAFVWDLSGCKPTELALALYDWCAGACGGRGEGGDRVAGAPRRLRGARDSPRLGRGRSQAEAQDEALARRGTRKARRNAAARACWRVCTRVLENG